MFIFVNFRWLLFVFIFIFGGIKVDFFFFFGIVDKFWDLLFRLFLNNDLGFRKIEFFVFIFVFKIKEKIDFY